MTCNNPDEKKRVEMRAPYTILAGRAQAGAPLFRPSQMKPPQYAKTDQPDTDQIDRNDPTE
jgi:hypothetical protein